MRQLLIDDGTRVIRDAVMIATLSLGGVGGSDRAASGRTAMSSLRTARADRRAAGSQRRRREPPLTGAAVGAQRFRRSRARCA